MGSRGEGASDRANAKYHIEYSPSHHQARIIFNTIRLWCSTVLDLATDSIVRNFDGEVHRKSIEGVRYKAITSSPYSALGGNYAVVICDEVGHWRDNQLQVAIRHGMKSTPRDRRLFLQASTVPNLDDTTDAK